MKLHNIYFRHCCYCFVTILFGLLISSCQKKEIATFTTPSTYRFNSPTLVDKSYYVNVNNDYKRITDTLETFVVDNEDLADSLNTLFNNYFRKQILLSFEFITSNEVNIISAQLDIVDNKFIYINRDTIKSNYKFEGNDLKIDALPDTKLNLDNFFLELRQCFHAADKASYYRTNTDTTMTRDYDLRPCSFADDKSYIQAMQPNVGRIDTVAIYKLNVVYSKY